LPESEAVCGCFGAGRCVEMRYDRLRIHGDAVIGCRNGGKQLGLTDTQFTLAQARLEMSRHMADQGHVADCEHQRQNGNSYPCRLDHKFILIQFRQSNPNMAHNKDKNIGLICHTSSAAEWL
jgi:hypothetical protein